MNAGGVRCAQDICGKGGCKKNIGGRELQRSGLKVWKVKNAHLNVTITLLKLWLAELILFNNGSLHFIPVDFLSHDPLGLTGVVVM